jgi:ATP-binding cassette subfamily F protein 3
MEVAGVRKAYGDNVVYESLDFMITRGDKLALVGPNGAGKSTLLKLLANVIEADAGEVRLANGVEFAYFAQHSVEQLDLSRTILEEMVAYSTHETSGRERDILGAFGFAGNDAVKRRISVLSGGEKTRLALAKLMLRPSGVLLLDEPTNHLDIASRQVLEEAIRQFGGAVCIVSHDRFFLNEVVERVVHIEHGELTEYLGDYDYYKWSREQQLAELQGEGGDQEDTSRVAGGTLSKKELRRAMAELRDRRMAESGDLRAEVSSLEKQIEESETRKGELEAMMADPEVYQDASKLPEVSKEYNQLSEDLLGLMERWEEKLFELEEIDERYEAEEAALRGDL